MHLLHHLVAGTATTAGGSDSNSSSGAAALIQLGIFLLIPFGLYFLMIRPQRRRQREQVAMQQAIEVGDEIMTTSGLYGFVTGFDGDIAWLEIDDNIQIRIARQAIQRKVDTAMGETATPDDDGTKNRQTKIGAPAAAVDDES